MKVGVLGLWHLGSVTAACLAAADIATVAVDADPQVVAGLNRGEPPLFEPQLAELVREGMERGTLVFSSELAALAAVDIVWVCHDAPVDEEDRADVARVVGQIEAVFPHLRDGAVVLVSAQLPVGTVAALECAFARCAGRRTVDFACSPENLRLGRAIHAFRNPGRIVIGVRNDRARRTLTPLLARLCDTLIWTKVESAEMAKHALNAFLASAITLTNEIAVICEQVGADAAEVETALRSDPRIGAQAYVRAGPAFGGGTLARDLRYLLGLAQTRALNVPLIASVIASNDAHRAWMLDTLHARLGSLRSRKLAVLGLAYKPGTDAIRRSPAVELVRQLIAESAQVSAFDPMVRVSPSDIAAQLTLARSAPDAMTGAAAVVIGTEWPQFRTLTAEDFVTHMDGNLVIDPGRFLAPALAHDPRLKVVSIGSAS
ncbi:MAG TPA: nucleotide sugar dehydrogenase [Xanthobacteraceae bacterium]|nr:nucleotide sugar dehydrogenase [Xanthobacteraceae bacterium]